MNIYSAPQILNVIIIIFLASFILKNKKTPSNILFVTGCISVIVWFAAYFIAYNQEQNNSALLWFKIGYTGVIFIPTVTYHFVITFLNKKVKIINLFLPYFLSSLFILLLWTTDYFIKDVNRYFWGYYPRASLLHPFFVVFYSVLLVKSFIHPYLEYKEANISPLESSRRRYLALSLLIGSFGGIDFIPNYGIGIYPFGFIFVVGWIGITVYAIIKYRLLDINVALTRAGVFLFVYFFILGLPFATALLFKGQLSAFLGPQWWMVPLALMAVLATLGPFVYAYLQRQVEARSRAEEFRSHELLKQASEGMIRIHSIKDLLGLIVHITVKTLRLENAAVFLFDGNSGNFKLSAVRQRSKYHYLESLVEGDPLVEELSLSKEPLVYEELRLKAQDAKDASANAIQEILSQMQQLGAAIIVPAIARGRMLGFLALGEKRNKKMYSQEDIAVLEALSYQAALAIENAIFYEKEKIWLAEQSKRQALGEMAPGASHQFDNRLNNISAVAENLLDILKNDLAGLSREQVAEMVISDLEAIKVEVDKGKQITDAILQRSKVKLEFAPTDIVKVIENAINLTNLRRTRESLAGAKKPEFIFNHPEGLPLLNLCEGPIQDVFENMFNNAIDAIVIKDKRKLEPDYSGRIKVEISLQEKFVEITVEDNGIGVKSENLHKLFTPLFTTKATSEKGVVGGSGLGLSVMQSFVEDHGGTIKVESEYLKWTRFTVKLPLDFKPRREESRKIEQ